MKRDYAHYHVAYVRTVYVDCDDGTDFGWGAAAVGDVTIIFSHLARQKGFDASNSKQLTAISTSAAADFQRNRIGLSLFFLLPFDCDVLYTFL